jgi:hypothetical protein
VVALTLHYLFYVLRSKEPLVSHFSYLHNRLFRRQHTKHSGRPVPRRLHYRMQKYSEALRITILLNHMYAKDEELINDCASRSIIIESGVKNV